MNKFLYRRGGAEGYMLDLVERQRDDGHDVKVFGMDHPENDADQILGPLPSHVEFEPPPPTLRDRLHVAGRMIWSREVRHRMESALSSWEPDVIHCHNIYHQLSPSVLAPAKRRAIPVVLTMHDYKLVCATYEFLDKGEICTACVTEGPLQAAKRACKDGSRAASTIAAAEVWLHQRLGAYDPVRRFIAPSQFLADQVRAADQYPDRVVVLDNFTDLKEPAEICAKNGSAVFAGRLSAEKGVDTLIRAVSLLPRSLSGTCEQVVLDIAGDGPERSSLERLAQDVAPGRIRFHGRLPKPQLEALLRACVVSVVPSRWLENQPLSVLEAFACGVPVIATNLGGLPEIVTDGETGWLIGANSPEFLMSALQEALTDPQEAHRRGKAAYRLAQQRFDPNAHLEALHRIYREAGSAA